MQLQTELANVTADPSALSTTSPYIPPAAGTFNVIDKEMQRQISNALNDKNCVEIAFSVVPGVDTSNSGVFAGLQGNNIQLTPGTTLPTKSAGGGNNDYVYILNIRTKLVDDF